MPVVSIYAGILGFWLVILSTRVVLFRRRARVNLGHGGNDELERRIRAQANLAEYAPMGLILIGLLEFSGWPLAAVHALGVLLVAGRLLHGWTLSFTTGSGVGRVGGMALTLTAIGIAAIMNLFEAFEKLTAS